MVESFAQGHLHRQPLVTMPLAKTALPATLCSAADAFAMAVHDTRWRREKLSRHTDDGNSWTIALWWWWWVPCAVCSVRCGAWCVVCGVWCVVCGVWCVVCGVRCAVCGVRCAVCGVRCVVCGVWCVVCGVCGGGWVGGWVSPKRNTPIDKRRTINLKQNH